MRMLKTYSIKQSEIQKDWILIDAKNLVLGRLAVIIAKMLRGKHKPTFTPHMDCGDHIVVINADKMVLTGNKLSKDGKIYYRHTGFPGGIKSITAQKAMDGDKSTFVLRKAVERMISRNKLGRQQMKHLYLYSNEEHKHEAQKPTVLDVASLNSKNFKN
ncbi:MAG: 50S ribosomal protein L13 [Alphaproteobacteria bacterium]|nr:50S ribosomal protein L13 [Alphaproteobacteria bacterium]